MGIVKEMVKKDLGLDVTSLKKISVTMSSKAAFSLIVFLCSAALQHHVPSL